MVKIGVTKSDNCTACKLPKAIGDLIVHFAREHLKVPVSFVGFTEALSRADLFQKTILFSVKVLFLSNKFITYFEFIFTLTFLS